MFSFDKSYIQRCEAELSAYGFQRKGTAFARVVNDVAQCVVLEKLRSGSNANLLRTKGGQKKYSGIAKALFAYAVQVSIDAGFDGILFFKAKTSELLDYYMQEFGARQVASYDPFRLVIWEDAAENIVSEFVEEE